MLKVSYVKKEKGIILIQNKRLDNEEKNGNVSLMEKRNNANTKEEVS